MDNKNEVQEDVKRQIYVDRRKNDRRGRGTLDLPGFDDIIGNSYKMREIFDLVRKVSKSDVSVLITGESGTGKELLARAIHRNSYRSEKPFIAVNCAAMPDNLLESELFGHERGAFTGAVIQRKGKFELSNGGTLFLDEIADMSLPAQAKILRVLEEHTLERVGGQSSINVDIRVIAATNKDLRREVINKNFREDLFYRLNEVSVHLPSLRDRKEDIPLLVNFFINSFSSQFGKSKKKISDVALRYLLRHSWPGNIRELENVIKRSLVLLEGDTIWIEHLPLDIQFKSDDSKAGAGLGGPEAGAAGEVQDDRLLPLDDVEKVHIKKVLQYTNWNKKKTSEILKVSRPTLDRKIEKYQLTRGS
jgi:DNA-binding NtrC family response regulator